MRKGRERKRGRQGKETGKKEKKIFSFGVFGFMKKKKERSKFGNFIFLLFDLIRMKSVFLHLYNFKSAV